MDTAGPNQFIWSPRNTTQQSHANVHGEVAKITYNIISSPREPTRNKVDVMPTHVLVDIEDEMQNSILAQIT